MTPHPRDDVGQPPWLPDFVDPSDLGESSLEASGVWGEDQRSPAPVGRSRGAAEADEHEVPPRRRGGFGQSGRSAARGSRRTTSAKPRLTWAQKQERREARAQKRQEQEAAERAADPMGFAREIVLTQLTAAPRSRAYLAQKLRAKEVDEEVIEAVLDRMEDVGLVDDAAYAGMLVRSQLASRGLARPALARELKRKGIEGEDAQEALAQVDDDVERGRALELARKKLATMTRLDTQTQTRRLAGLLARKGYPAPLVWSVVKEVLAAADPGSVDPGVDL